MTIITRATNHTELDRRARQAWDELNLEQQIAAICRMSDEGHGDYGVAYATGWHVELVRRLLAQRRARRRWG